ncbi:MAG: aminoacyltransferase [Candidatus Moranbacteria bacterium]|nr:aminoacyltransferase [Candidatus Moranbacteria bacterium]
MTENQSDELLQSEEWIRFQEAAGHPVVRLGDSDWSANGIVHALPVVGKYLYVPRGPRTYVNQQKTDNGDGFRNSARLSYPDNRMNTGNEGSDRESGIMREAAEAILEKARTARAGWIRIEPETEAALAEMREVLTGYRIVKAPHDMQPRETFVVDLSLSEEELLAAMKPKTRYNIGVARKRGVRVIVSMDPNRIEAFIRLVTGTADRKGIVPHPRAYYEAMCETLLGNDGKIFAAEKDGEVVAANLVVFHGNTATYLHGGSDDRHRADMAPFLLQWEAMLDAKRRGCSRYDFGGVSMPELECGEGKWLGITRFKTGFSPKTSATAFPGAYDIVLSPVRYLAYRMIRKAKGLT